MTLPPTFLTTALAHRGLHDAAKGIIENSIDAFQAAIDHGYGIECDLQLSLDQQPMVFHDYDMTRLTGNAGPIQRQTAAQLAQTRLSGSANTINTLPDILDLIDGRVPLLIELKDQDGAMGPDIGPLEDQTAKALQGYSGDVAVMSFNPHSVTRMAKLLPQIPRGIVTSNYAPKDWPLSVEKCDELRAILDYDTSGSCFISHEAADLNRPRVAQLKQQGAAILCWTIRSQAQADTALKVADNITFEGYLPA